PGAGRDSEAERHSRLRALVRDVDAGQSQRRDLRGSARAPRRRARQPANRRCHLMTRTISIVDVAARDGLQMEPTVLEPGVRAELVHRLADAGVRRIEVTSFVNAAKVPQMAHPEGVVAAVEARAGVAYSALVLNERGYARLAETTLAGVNFSFAITDSYNRRNQGQTVEESIAAARRVVQCAHESGRHAAVTFAVTFGCPFEGRVDPVWVYEVASRILEAEPDELVLADTVGVATPTRVGELVRELAASGTPIGVHL